MPNITTQLRESYVREIQGMTAKLGEVMLRVDALTKRVDAIQNVTGKTIGEIRASITMLEERVETFELRTATQVEVHDAYVAGRHEHENPPNPEDFAHGPDLSQHAPAEVDHFLEAHEKLHELYKDTFKDNPEVWATPRSWSKTIEHFINRMPQVEWKKKGKKEKKSKKNKK